MPFNLIALIISVEMVLSPNFLAENNKSLSSSPEQSLRDNEGIHHHI